MDVSLSDLPEDLLHHIFSCIHDLTNQEAIRLSRLSKQFQRVLQHRPTLVFDTFNVPEKSEAEFAKKYSEELNYIHSTLQRYHRENTPLETFTLTAYVSDSYKHLYNGCIELAAKIKGLKNLHLWMGFVGYVIPQHIFELESLVTLTLENCLLMPESIIAWPNLKRLKIEFHCVSSDEEVFKNIVNGCPSIEYLKVDLRCFTGFNFRVSDLRNLKKLNIRLGEDQRLEVNTTPNLEYIKCRSSYYINKYFLGFGSTEYPSLRNLMVTGGELDKNFFIDFARRFPILEKMHLQTWETLETIKLSSKSLKEIKLVGDAELQEACFDVPNLARFDYSNCDNEFKIPKFTFAGTSSKWSSCTELADDKNNIDASRFLELNDFLAALNLFETSITVRFVGNNLFFNEAHPVIANLNRVRGIKEFSIYIDWREISASSVSAILDAIFSIFQPQTFTFLFGAYHHHFPKLLYEKLVSRSSHHYRSVTDFEMFGTSGQGSRLRTSSDRFKDWDKLVEVLKEKMADHINFQLEYFSGEVEDNKYLDI